MKKVLISLLVSVSVLGCVASSYADDVTEGYWAAKNFGPMVESYVNGPKALKVYLEKCLFQFQRRSPAFKASFVKAYKEDWPCKGAQSCRQDYKKGLAFASKVIRGADIRTAFAGMLENECVGEEPPVCLTFFFEALAVAAQTQTASLDGSQACVASVR